MIELDKKIVLNYIIAGGLKKTYKKRGGVCIMKCWVCGKEGANCTRDITAEYKLYYEIPIRKTVKAEHQRCYCKKCYEDTMKRLAIEDEQYVTLKRKRMFENALDKLERQQLDFVKYEEAIKTIEEYNLENDGKFDSSQEIMAAIILIQNRYHIKPQAKVGSYQVDFMFPEDNLILEIDGDRHNFKKSYDKRRDATIKEILGSEWQILRIPTDMIDQKAEKLPLAIEQLLDYKATNKVNWRAL